MLMDAYRRGWSADWCRLDIYTPCFMVPIAYCPPPHVFLYSRISFNFQPFCLRGSRMTLLKARSEPSKVL